MTYIKRRYEQALREIFEGAVLFGALAFALGCLTVAMMLALARMIVAPRAEDRVLAFDCLSANTMLVILALGLMYRTSSYFEAALLIACSDSWAPRPWPSSSCARYDRRPRRRHYCGGRQPADPPVRTWRAWVVMAAATVMRLQTIVSREVAAAESAVVTVGSLQAGTKENVISGEAVIKLNVRTFDEGVRKRVLAAIDRIVNAEAAASGAPKPPEITLLDRYPLVVNDRAATERVVDAFRHHFSTDRVRETGPAPASEDFGSFGAGWHTPSVFWFVGGTDPERYSRASAAGRLNEIPTNHNPAFAPVIHPTLETGVEAMVVAARAWLAGWDVAAPKTAGAGAAE